MERRVKAVFDKYANFITASPETTADVEMLCKYLSYFVSGESSLRSSISGQIYEHFLLSLAIKAN